MKKIKLLLFNLIVFLVPFVVYAGELETACSDYALANLLYITKRIIKLLWIIAPIIGILGLTIAFIKLFMDPDDKKRQQLHKRLINTIIALLVVYFIPALFSLALEMTSNKFDFSACWTNAENIHEMISE